MEIISQEALDQIKKKQVLNTTMPAHVYANSVLGLMKVALTQSGSGAKAAAQVLLSTYNGYNYHLDPTDLILLDANHYESAIYLIKGRVEFGREPHDLLKNGSKIFASLEERWPELHVNNRYNRGES